MSRAAEAVRSHRQIWAAPGSSHDKVIAVLRIILPAAVGILIALLATAPVTVGRDISFVLSKDRVQVAKERMRVSQAEYRGQDQKGQPFSINAQSAVQQTSKDPIVNLTDLSAKIVLDSGPATIGAKTGRYNMDTEKVVVDGNVVLHEADGYQIATRDVSIDLNTRQVESGGAVDGTMRLGHFSANKLTADLTQRIVRLEGGARLHIIQGQARGKK
jgi:lipopolysaccharide export system protein LptC